MTTPQDALLAGVMPADKQILDFNTAPRIKEPKNPVGNLLTKEQVASMHNRGVTPPANPVPATQPLNPLPPPPAAPVQSAGVQSMIPGLTPPITAQDTPRVKDRINQLWGQKKTAEERVAALEESNARLLEALNRSEARFQAPGVPPPGASHFTPSFTPSPLEPIQQGPQPGAGEYVSRHELLAALDMHTRQILQHSAVQGAHSVSRAEAERDFPEVYGNPDLRAAAEQILADEPAFSKDPKGPYKAAALVRGLYGVQFGGGPPPSGAPTAARKEALTGVGASVPEGPGTPDALFADYENAMRIAQMSGKEEDAARARLIHRQLLERQQ